MLSSSLLFLFWNWISFICFLFSFLFSQDYVATRWYRAPELCGSFFSKVSSLNFFPDLGFTDLCNECSVLLFCLRKSKTSCCFQNASYCGFKIAHSCNHKVAGSSHVTYPRKKKKKKKVDANPDASKCIVMWCKWDPWFNNLGHLSDGPRCGREVTSNSPRYSDLDHYYISGLQEDSLEANIDAFLTNWSWYFQVTYLIGCAYSVWEIRFFFSYVSSLVKAFR